MTTQQQTISSDSSETVMSRATLARSRSELPGALNSGITRATKTSSRKSPARLTVAEKAFARGLKALREKNYREAKRQLSGFLELTGASSRLGSAEPSARQAHRLQGIRVVVESLQLLLAISEEITILEREVR